MSPTRTVGSAPGGSGASSLERARPGLHPRCRAPLAGPSIGGIIAAAADREDRPG
ncbi:hypothetical protein ACFPM0_32890 [Pseudonocardia sulfidoxydans]|uniref:hypothetical protein n=1 Tax=Pseudonocardia sulfidoxydans TaxID=54011 RepID=UPI00361E7D95